MAKRCIDFDGKLIQFPRGTYYEQTAEVYGRIEISLIEELWRTGQAILRRSDNWANASDVQLNKDMRFFRSLGMNESEIRG